MRIEFQYGSAWYTVATKYEWPGGVVVQLLTLGHNLAVAGATEAMFRLGYRLHEAEYWGDMAWAPNVSGAEAPGAVAGQPL